MERKGNCWVENPDIVAAAAAAAIAAVAVDCTDKTMPTYNNILGIRSFSDGGRVPDGLCQFESLSRFARLAYREAMWTCARAPHLDSLNMGSAARRQHIGFETLLVYNAASYNEPVSATVSSTSNSAVSVSECTTSPTAPRRRRRSRKWASSFSFSRPRCGRHFDSDAT